MNKIIAQLLLLAGCLLLLQGCYTQLATYEPRESYSGDGQEEPAYDDAAEALPEDSLAEDDSSTVAEEWPDHRRPPIGFDYYYPSWYPAVVIYDPWYAWDSWGCTYGYPWWWARPWYTWSGYYGWYALDHPWVYRGYGGTWYVPESRSTTRNSGTRRSGTAARRDYDGVRSMSVGSGSSAGMTAGRSSAGRTDVRAATPGTAGRSSGASATTRQAPSTSRTRTSTDRRTSTPARSWTLPELFGRSSGSSSSGSSSSSSSSGSSERSSTRSEPAARPAPSYSPPASSPAPTRSSAPSSSSGNGGRSSEGSRSSGSSRSR